MELKPLLGIIKPEGHDQTRWHPLQINFVDAVASSLKQSDLVLADGQNVESSVPAQQRQQWLDVKSVGDDDQLLQSEGQAVTASEIGREKDRQTIALVPPEQAILHKLRSGCKQCLCVGSAKTSCNQTLLSMPN
jgi:hypothetical protein